MAQPLDDYRKKRNFKATPEPDPAAPDTASKDCLAFVIHRHEASRLHYDLRLEMDGVLCSFAVPKGFSYNRQNKHLAVRTEDHPMEYEHFEGVIPKGQYGAGTMLIWDKGHYEWTTELTGRNALEQGELKLRLFGRKLRGEWHLVKIKADPKAWLLFKSKDRYAGPERDTALGIDVQEAPATPMPQRLRPTQATAMPQPFDDPEWLFEMEFVGQRCLAQVVDGEATLRGQRSKAEALLPILADLQQIAAETALIDGMLVALDDGRPSKAVLDACLARERDDPIYYYAFDLLYFEDYDLRSATLLDRKAALRTVVQPPDRSFGSLLYVDHVTGQGISLARAVAEAGLPGMIARRGNSRYRSGSSKDWGRIAIEPTSARATPRSTAKKSSGRVKFSNLGKVYWPAEGYTKSDLIAFYQRVADTMLPYLRDRPVHMNRFPDGIDGKSFYQKEAKNHVPDWVDKVPIDSDKRGEPLLYMMCNDTDSLLHLANLGSIDLHPWLSRRNSLLQPDFAVLDLDPKEAPFGHVIRIARHLGKVLRGLGLRPYLKTSGKTGLHIYVPLLAGYSYDHSRMFCEAVARMVVRDLPDIATVERGLGAREGKVYVDFLQNRRGQTLVPPYCARPVRGATVSTPLHWDELDRDLHPSQFTIQTVLPRLEQHGDLFRGTLTDQQDLLPAIEAVLSQ